VSPSLSGGSPDPFAPPTKLPPTPWTPRVTPHGGRTRKAVGDTIVVQSAYQLPAGPPWRV
jgi:hypothetical protein